MPEHFIVNDNMIEAPASPEDADKVEVLRGPNIKPFPKTEKLPEDITAKAVLKVGDNITTDHIMPAGAKFFLTVQTFLTFHSIALPYVTKHSLKELRQKAKALLSEAQTTVKAHQRTCGARSALSRS